MGVDTTDRDANRRQIYVLLDTAHEGNRSSKFIDLILVVLIFISIIAVVLESIPQMEARYDAYFYWLEVFTVSIFTVEYILRIWTAVDDPRFANCRDGALVTRVKFILTPYALIDLIAIVPFYLLLFGLFPNVDMRFIRAVRLLRILKLTRYSSAFNMLATCCKENSRALSAAFFILLTVMLLAASGIYFFEREAQPVAFGSIPAAMWWAFATLTTVGYGDVTPMTVGGKVFGACITVIGVGMVALPTGILASAYAQQIRVRSAKFEAKADEALNDGVLSNLEVSQLEEYRKNLGIGKDTASQILDSKTVEMS